MKNAKRIDLRQVERGKYFRIVADVILDGKSLSEILLKNSLTTSYDGGKKDQKRLVYLEKIAFLSF